MTHGGVRSHRRRRLHPKVAAGTLGAELVAAAVAIFGLHLSPAAAAAAAGAANLVFGWAKGS